MPRSLLFVLLLLFTGTSRGSHPSLLYPPNETYPVAQDPVPITWRMLANVKVENIYNEKFDMNFYGPVYSDMVKRLDGQLVQIKGYVIPFDKEQQSVALSANPNAACFFCGKGSAASVLMLHFAEPGKRYKIDDRITFQGRLRLNYDSPDDFYYIIEEAKEI